MSPNVNNLKKSKYLQQHEVEPPITVTIDGYEEVNMARENDPPDMSWVLYFLEAKPLSLNPTNGEMIAYVMEHTYGIKELPGDFDTWIGKKIILYVDPSVSYGGKRTGGIRVRPPVLPTTAGMTQPQQQQYNDAPIDDGPPIGDDPRDFSNGDPDDDLPEALR